MVAAVARDEPQIAPNIAQPPTVAIARPPRQCPTQARVAWNSARLIPALVANCPIRRNNGTTDSVYEENRS